MAEARRAAGLTQRDLAQRIGISMWTLNRLETGAISLEQLPEPARAALREALPKARADTTGGAGPVAVAPITARRVPPAAIPSASPTPPRAVPPAAPPRRRPAVEPPPPERPPIAPRPEPALTASSPAGRMPRSAPRRRGRRELAAAGAGTLAALAVAALLVLPGADAPEPRRAAVDSQPAVAPPVETPQPDDDTAAAADRAERARAHTAQRARAARRRRARAVQRRRDRAAQRARARAARPAPAAPAPVRTWALAETQPAGNPSPPPRRQEPPTARLPASDRPPERREPAPDPPGRVPPSGPDAAP